MKVRMEEDRALIGSGYSLGRKKRKFNSVFQLCKERDMVEISIVQSFAYQDRR